MATLVSRASEYFGSINPLAKKILQEQEALERSYGERWNHLSETEQEDIFDNYFVEAEAREKYAKQNADETDGQPEVFPRLKVNCGEKIIVDFDNDQGWTWRDEHSAPFSWETRSQQDLPLFDEEDAGIEKDTDGDQPKRPPRKPRKSRSPERDATLAFKPEKSIWESPFLAADRGLDSGYPSSQASDQSKNSSADDAEDLLSKFGITLSMSSEKDETQSFSANEETKLLDLSEDFLPKGTKFDDSMFTADFMAKAEAEIESWATNQADPVVSDKRWKSTDQKAGAQLALMDSKNNSVTSSPAKSSTDGQLSPVYIEDPGESSTDGTLAFDFSMPTANTSGGQVNLALDDSMDDKGWATKLDTKEEDKPSGDTSQPKTGFSFLDDW